MDFYTSTQKNNSRTVKYLNKHILFFLMKKYIFLVILFLIPFTFAGVYIDSTFEQKYNLGDQVSLSGYLVESENIQANLNLILDCENGSSQIYSKYVRLISDIPKDFNFNFVITSDTTGDCELRLELKNLNGTIIDQTTSNTFEITKELNSVFKIEENQNLNDFQLGDEIRFSGTVLNLEGVNVDGLATIYLRNDDINYLVGSVEVINGNFQYSTNLLFMPAGEYSVDFNIKDINGNEEFYSDSLKFNLEDNLIIDASTNKNSYLPGDIITISGTVKKKIGGSLTNNNIQIELDGESYDTSIEKGSYAFNIPTSTTIKSYDHNITLKVGDEYGNYGEKEILVSIIPVPTTFSIELDKSSYAPEEEITIIPNLIDQAGDILSKRVDIKIKNPKDDIVYEDTGLTTDEIKYKLPQFSMPGDWEVQATSSELDQEALLKVDFIKIIDVSLSGEVLAIKNLGNDLYEDEVTIDGNGILKTKKVKLKPNETEYVPLFKLFDGGTYTISVLGKQFDDVTILDRGLLSGITGMMTYSDGSGNSNLKLSSMLILTLILVGIVLIGYVGYKRGFAYYLMRIPDHKRRRYDRLEGSKRAQELRSTKKKYNFDFGKSTEQDIQEFRTRMINSIDESNKKNRFDINKDDKPKGGNAFSMFD